VAAAHLGTWRVTGGALPLPMRTEIRFVNLFTSGDPSLRGQANVADGTLSGTFDTLFSRCTSGGAVDCVRHTNPLLLGPLPSPFPVIPPSPPDIILPAPSVGSGLWWSFTQGARTLSFTVDGGADAPGVVVQSRPRANPVGGGLSIRETGVFELAGSTDTPGLFELASQGIGARTNFSASYVATPVPVPAALGLFGYALAGLWLWRGWLWRGAAGVEHRRCHRCGF